MRYGPTLVVLVALAGCGGASADRDAPRPRATAAADDARDWAQQAKAVCARRLKGLRDVGPKARAVIADDTLSDREKARRIADQFGRMKRAVQTTLAALQKLPRPQSDRRPAAFVSAYASFHDLLAGAVQLHRDGDIRAGDRHLRTALDWSGTVAERGKPLGIPTACLPQIEPR